MADAGLGCGVGVGCLVEPGSFIDQAAKTASPLMEEFVDVVARIWSTTSRTTSLGRRAHSLRERRRVGGRRCP